MHGYDDAFMAACRNELAVRLGQPGHRSSVADKNGAAVGFVEISVDTTAELEKLFVEPSEIGNHVGRRLFTWASAEAAAHGAKELMIDSDPGARGFYLALGAEEVGLSPSGSIPGRFLPRLRFDLRRISP